LDTSLVEALAPHEQAMGLSVSQDILAQLGDTWALVSAPSLGGFGTGTVLTVEVKDAAAGQKLLASLARLAEYLRTRHDGLLVGTMPAGPAEIRYLQFAGRVPVPVAPAWAVHEGRLYVAGWLQVVASAIDGAARQPLAKSPRFREVRARLKGAASLLVYVDAAELARHSYGWMLLAWTALSNMPAPWGSAPAEEGEAPPPMRADWLPPLSWLEKYCRPQCSVITSDAEGVSLEGYGVVPAPGLLLLPATSPVSLMLVPALLEARAQAKQAVSMSNLRMVGIAAIMYAQEHDGQLPTGLDELVREGVVPPQSLVSPLSGRAPPTLEGGKLVGEVDYVYVRPAAGKLHAIENPARTVLAYERLDNRGGAATVAVFADGHVEQLTGEQLNKLLEAPAPPPGK